MKTLKGVLFWVVMALLLAVTAFALYIMNAAWYGWALLVLAAALLALRYAGNPGFLKRVLCVAGCVLLLFSSIFFGRPDMRVSVEGTLAREGIAFARGLDAFNGDRYFDTVNEMKSTFKAPGGMTLQRGELGGVPAEMMNRSNHSDGVTVFMLHGGGYRVPLQDIYRKLAVRFMNMPSVSDVIMLDYSVAPEAVYPMALDQAKAAWNALAADGMNILLVGDSAGANLALALTQTLIQDGGVLPKGMVLISPWADIGRTGELSADHDAYDPLFGGEDDALLPGAYFEGANLSDPLVSPIYADYAGFPPMLTQVGECEMMWSDAYTINARALAAGVNSTLTEYRGMFHTFQLAGSWIPEAARAMDEITRFIGTLNPAN